MFDLGSAPPGTGRSSLYDAASLHLDTQTQPAQNYGHQRNTQSNGNNGNSSRGQSRGRTNAYDNPLQYDLLDSPLPIEMQSQSQSQSQYQSSTQSHSRRESQTRNQSHGHGHSHSRSQSQSQNRAGTDRPSHHHQHQQQPQYARQTSSFADRLLLDREYQNSTTDDDGGIFGFGVGANWKAGRPERQQQQYPAGSNYGYSLEGSGNARRGESRDSDRERDRGRDGYRDRDRERERERERTHERMRSYHDAY